MNKHSQNDFKTYVVGGKGFYTLNEAGAAKDVFNVPANCTIVLTTINESVITDDKPLLHHYMEYYQKLFQKDFDTLKNPKSFRDKLGNPQSFKDELGETTVYKTNDKCPDIHETLLLYDDGKCFTNMNGIVDISAIYPDVGLPDLDASIHDLTSDECKSVDFLKSIYKLSYYPSFNSKLEDYIQRFNQNILLKEWEKKLSIANNNFSTILHDTELSGIVYCLVVKKSMQVYIISGHGSEDLDSTFIVPKGCTIVVHSISGRVSYDTVFRKKLDILFYEIPFQTLQYPNNDIKIKLDTIIYNEGTICPLFNYDLHGFLLNDEEPPMLSSLMPEMTGLINVSLLYRKLDKTKSTISILGKNIPELNTIHTTNSSNIQPKITLLSSLYRYSIFPTLNEVKLYYTYNTSQRIYKTWKDNDLIKINQLELCQMYPGVYYNFVCRVPSTTITPENKNILLSQNTQNTSLPGTLVRSGIRTKKNSGEHVFSNTVRKALERRAGEAHMFKRDKYALLLRKKISDKNQQIELIDSDIKLYTDEYKKWEKVLRNPKEEQEQIQSLPEPIILSIEKILEIANNNTIEYKRRIDELTKMKEDTNKELETLNNEFQKLSLIKTQFYNSMKKGGGPLPLRYFDPNAYQSSASAGSDVLGVSGLEVRPKIGGKRTKRVTKRTRTTRRMKGGFIPSIMEPFIFGCSKYIAPLAALSGWKLINMPTNRKTKRVTRK